MLAQSFKTAVELGITDEGLEGLQKVLVILEMEQIEHIPMGYEGYDIQALKNPNATRVFNMRTWNSAISDEPNCGTVHCIGGLAEALMGKKVGAIFHDGFVSGIVGKMPIELQDLFYPGGPQVTMTTITVAQAANALRGYLETGHTDWQAAIA